MSRRELHKVHRCEATAQCDVCCNPRVILGPFLSDTASGSLQQRQSALPPTATLYNEPELSDVVLRVRDERFYAHRVILAAGSGVFSRMLAPGGDWRESNQTELSLQESADCAKVFDRFLYYFYTGIVRFEKTSVINLFMLADKYDVKSLVDECGKVIKDGLKVYTISKAASVLEPSSDLPMSRRGPGWPSGNRLWSSAPSSSDSDSEEAPPGELLRVHLVASETFTLTVVTELLCVAEAGGHVTLMTLALGNIEARLAAQLRHNCHAAWNELGRPLVERLLADTHFYCDERLLLRAVRTWLAAHGSEHGAALYPLIRYPLLATPDLYEAECEPAVRACPTANALVGEACRHRLFAECATPEDLTRWQCEQFTERHPRQTISTEGAPVYQPKPELIYMPRPH